MGFDRGPRFGVWSIKKYKVTEHYNRLTGFHSGSYTTTKWYGTYSLTITSYRYIM